MTNPEDASLVLVVGRTLVDYILVGELPPEEFYPSHCKRCQSLMAISPEGLQLSRLPTAVTVCGPCALTLPELITDRTELQLTDTARHSIATSAAARETFAKFKEKFKL